MSDRSDFESRLSAALVRRADGAPVAVDASAVTRAAATARMPVGARVFGVPGWRGARLVLVVALTIALLVAALAIGSRLVSPAPTLPLGRLVPAGEMTVARGGPTATLLQDGRVLLAGGQVDSQDQATTELYDPADGSFTPTGSLSTLWRVWAAAAPLPDGRVLLVGGIGQTPDSEDVITFPFGEIYDPSSGTFARTSPMIHPRQTLGSVLTLPDGRVLISGGDDGIRAVELFDPATETFVDGGSLLTPRTGHTMTLLPDGRVLMAGGDGGDGAPVATAEIYDPATGTSVPTGDLGVPRFDHTAAMLADGRVLILGGIRPEGSDFETLASSELFDPTTGAFTPAGSLITERQGARLVTLGDGRVLVAGGHNDDGDPRTLEVYDPASGAFAVAGRLVPTQSSGNSGWLSTTLLDDGSVLLAGRDIATAERFVPNLPALPVDTAMRDAPVGFVAVDHPGAPGTGHTATRLADGRVLIAGGRVRGTGTPLTTAAIFDPATGGTSETGSMGAPRSDHTAALLADGRVLIVGGLGGADVSTAWPSAEIYDPAAGTFSPLGTMTVPTKPAFRGLTSSADEGHPMAVTLADGRVLVVGWDPTSVDASPRSTQVFDPASGTFSALELPAGALERGGPQSMSVLPDGRVLVLSLADGGLRAEVYDPIADAWQLGVTTSARAAFAATALADGGVLIAGGTPRGSGSGDESLRTAETWDPVSGVFSPAGDMGAGRTGASVTLLPDGRALIVGGFDHQDLDDGSSTNDHPSPLLWDPSSRTFSPAGTMAAQRSGHTATLLDDGRVLLVGGITRSPDRDQPDPPAAELYVGP